jgi:hypothetical protein
MAGKKNVDELSAQMASLKLKPTDKVTVNAVIGRWQPPTQGHKLLIKEAYDRSIKARDAEPFVYITDKIRNKPDDGWVHDNWFEYNMKNPLTGPLKYYYLSLMYPEAEFPGLRFIGAFNVDIQGDILQNTTRADFPYTIRTKLAWSFIDLTNDTFLTTNGLRILQMRKNLREKKAMNKRMVRPPRRFTGAPSTTCIDMMASRGYKTLNILVGSDRLEAFKKYNEKALNDKFLEAGEVVGIGDRGSAGNGQIFKIPLENKSVATGVLDFCEKESCSFKEGEYSGTNVRNVAYTLLTTAESQDILYLLKGIKMGNMGNIDCWCLINDIRRGGTKLHPISVADWNILLDSDPSTKQYKINIRECNNFIPPDDSLLPWYNRKKEQLEKTLKEYKKSLNDRLHQIKKNEGLRVTKAGRDKAKKLLHKRSLWQNGAANAPKLSPEEEKYLKEYEEYERKKGKKKYEGGGKKTRKEIRNRRRRRRRKKRKTRRRKKNKN